MELAYCAFFAHAEHQPLALTSLPPKMSHGPQASPALPLEEITARAGLAGLEALELRLVAFCGVALVPQRKRLRLVLLDSFDIAASLRDD